MRRLTFALAALAILLGASPAEQPSLTTVLGANTWLNGRPSAHALTGKVVVLDVFTVDCYNCRNVVPVLRDLYASQRSRGLAIVGIHSPETPPERGQPYVEAALKQQGIAWPVAIDNGFTLWNAYGVTSWPTQLFFDRKGRLRKTIVGDSQDDAVRDTVNGLLSEK